MKEDLLQVANCIAKEETIFITWFVENVKNKALHNVLYINFLHKYVIKE